MDVQQYTPDNQNIDITFTENAAKQVQMLLESDLAEEGTLGLRVFVQGGGCSGFQYGFSFEKESGDDDFVVESFGSTFLIDPFSATYLQGAVIDYKRDISGEQFTIKNPNATAHCGCGKSFA